MLLAAGCQSAGLGRAGAGPTGQAEAAEPKRPAGELPVQAVRCVYRTKPWMNLDAAGDRDPEGIMYRVLLEIAGGKTEWRDGLFHVEMYRLDRLGPNKVERTLVSDWHYPTTKMNRFDGGMIGKGYIFQLAWAKKDLAGKEIELITRYEDPYGHTVRSGTKRFRVPKYTS